jgi:hypothetical protein
MKPLTLMALFATTGLFACSTSEPTPTITPIPTGVYKIINVTVIDVEKGIAVPGQTITIVGDRINKIGAQVEPGPRCR